MSIILLIKIQLILIILLEVSRIRPLGNMFKYLDRADNTELLNVILMFVW